jgi:hypothetical protein
LAGAGRDKLIPTSAGLYRVRRVGFEGLDYIGQTGNSLRGRLGMLAGVFRDEMPYRDPHTAGPALWAMRHSLGCDFEASTAVFDGAATDRKGLEVLAITLHRVETGSSPTVNFGRMPPGYRSSSGNNSRLVATAKRFRGGPDADVPSSPASVSVHGGMNGDSMGATWMDWMWSPWTPAAEAGSGKEIGLYRVRSEDSSRLLYIGQGRIAHRLAAHLGKSTIAGHRQAKFFAAATEASWIAVQAPIVNLLEHENDLIASHVFTTGEPPGAQFLG